MTAPAKPILIQTRDQGESVWFNYYSVTQMRKTLKGIRISFIDGSFIYAEESMTSILHKLKAAYEQAN